MFTGIIVCVSPIIQVRSYKKELKINIKKPSARRHPEFLKLKKGHSVAINGVCLTVEKNTLQEMGFHLGYETLKITNWTKANLKNKNMNLELPLKEGDFIGGHLISGHVNGMAQVISCVSKGGSYLMLLKIPARLKTHVRKKGFIALNGISLTINAFKDNQIAVCFIPETVKRTNIKDYFQKGSLLTMETGCLMPISNKISR